MRQRWREEERGRVQVAEGDRKRKRETEREGKENRKECRGGVIPSCYLVFPRPYCPWAAVPPSSN